MMKKNNENSMAEYEKQVTPLEREVAPEDAFIKGSIFVMHERALLKKQRLKAKNNSSTS